jgi:hypothetical protein
MPPSCFPFFISMVISAEKVESYHGASERLQEARHTSGQMLEHVSQSYIIARRDLVEEDTVYTLLRASMSVLLYTLVVAITLQELKPPPLPPPHNNINSNINSNSNSNSCNINNSRSDLKLCHRDSRSVINSLQCNLGGGGVRP